MFGRRQSHDRLTLGALTVELPNSQSHCSCVSMPYGGAGSNAGPFLARDRDLRGTADAICNCRGSGFRL